MGWDPNLFHGLLLLNGNEELGQYESCVGTIVNIKLCDVKREL